MGAHGVLWITKGGPVVWPLLGLSLVTTTVVLERLLFWLRARSGDDALGALARREGIEAAERAVGRGMSLLETTITIAPMLGILGTVLGIIDCFDLLSDASRPDPMAISGGIAQALITTALGLAVAMGTILPFNWLRGRAHEALTRIERGLRRDGEGANPGVADEE